jgi:regulator of replication initiation timing
LIHSYARLLTQYSIDEFKKRVSVYSKYNNAQCTELDSIRSYIADLTAMHTNNLKKETIKEFKQRMTKHLEEGQLNLPQLYQESCVVRKSSVSEFERKEKGKCTTFCIAMLFKVC